MTVDDTLNDAVAHFRTAVANRLGLHFPDSNVSTLHDALVNRLERLRLDSSSYLTLLDDPGRSSPEWLAIAELVTVGETYFFRNRDQFQALCLSVLPQAIAAGKGGKRVLRILSAACSSGEEAYTMAMMLADNRDLLGGADYALHAIDLNPKAISRAQHGCYSPWSLRETPPDVRDRHFTPTGQSFTINDSIRSKVEFSQRNLLTPDDGFWQPGRFDVVFCRNVLMYMIPEAAQQVVARIASSLVPEGHVFLGHAETLRGLSNDFQLCHCHGTFYYRLLAPGRDDVRQGGQRDDAVSGGVTLPSWRTDQGLWYDEIGRSTERVATLASGAPRLRLTPAVAPLRTATSPTPTSGLAEILDLLRQERFAEASALLNAGAGQILQAPLAPLVRAVVDAHCGETMRAEAACRDLLADDPCNARALFLLALCREQSDDAIVAADLYRSSASHDAAFAMPHVRLALLARRSRQVLEAVRSFGSALALIDREDDINLALFAGGFSRQAIADLCRSQMTGSRR
jgi:chemotaxis protein methyltransferase CheR